ERQRLDERRIVEQAVLRVQDDVRRQRSRAETGELGGVHHRHRRLVAVDGAGRGLDRLMSERALDEVAHRVDRDVLAQVVPRDFHHTVIWAAPRPCGRPITAGHDDAAGARQDVLRAVALGHLRAERLDSGDADDARSGLLPDRLHLLLAGHEGTRIIPSRLIYHASDWGLYRPWGRRPAV